MTRTDAAPAIAEALLKQVQQGIKDAGATSTDPRTLTLAKQKDFYLGNQAGANLEHWAGLKPSDATKYDEFKRRIVISNHVGPGLNRYTNAIVGRDPEWGMEVEGQPVDPKDPDILALTDWHGAVRLQTLMQEADAAMRWGGRAYLRVLIPDAYRELIGAGAEGEKIIPSGSQLDLPAALRLIKAHVVDATQAGSVRDASGVLTALWYAYSVLVDDKPEARIDIYTRDTIGTYKVDGQNLAPISITENPLYDPENPLEFRTLMFEMRRDGGSMVDQSLVDLQNSLNVALSNIRKNNDLGGHRQYWTVNAASPRDEAGEPLPYDFGPQSVLDIQGDALADTSGNPVIGPTGLPVVLPTSVGTFDPVDSAGMREDADYYKRELLASLDQLWAIEGEGQISGESKKQSRNGFEKRLPAEAAPATAGIAYLIETAYLFGAWLIKGSTLARARLARVLAKPHLDTSPVSESTLTLLAQLQKDGQLSLETFLESVPTVPDASLELERIVAERATNPIAILAALEVGGMDKADAQRALQAAGYPVSAEAIARAEEMGSLEVAGMESDAAPTTTPRPAPQAAYAIGDRVQVKADSEHAMGGMTMGGAGTVEIIGTPALGIRLDDMPNEVHKWYVAEELQSEGVTQ